MSEPRSLLLLNYEFPPLGGGAANATLFLGRALADLGHRVTVITSALGADANSRVEHGITVHRLRTGRASPDRSTVAEMCRYILTASRKGPSIARSAQCDATIAFFSIPSGIVARWLLLRLGLPYVVSLRGSDVPGHDRTLDRQHSLTRPTRRAVLRRAGAIVANSDSLAATSRAADPFPVRVIANGVDCERFCPAVTPIPVAPFRLLFVGRVHREKNLGAVIAQLPALPEIELLVAGDGAQRAELTDHAVTLGVADRVRWLGWQAKDALPKLYREAHALVNPSLYEGSPNVVLEAMASGLPTVASDTPGNRSVVRQGENGLLFPLAEPAELRAALARLAADRSLAHRLGENGRARAVAEFSWIRCAESYLELLGAARQSTRFS
jgi:glycosyltransferase involved in cell wall biosynthesis